MKNIFLVISKFPPEYSGPGVRIPRFYDWLLNDKQEYKLQVLCNGIEQTESSNYQHNGIQVKRVCVDTLNKIFKFVPWLPNNFRSSIYYQFEFLKTLFVLMFSSKIPPVSLLHVAGHSGGTAAALLWAKYKRIPVIMELVTANAPVRQSYLFIFKTPKLQNLKVVALTRDIQQKCLSAGTPPQKIWCRPNPINEKKFKLVSTERKLTLRREHFKFSAEKFIIVNVAKMMPQKNQIFILDVLRYLPKNFCAVIAGPLIEKGTLFERDREYVNTIQTRIKAYGLEERVQFITDFVSSEEFMKAGDLYFMPAWNEGFGTPMMEAMACGLPVIANKDEPAFQEWINENNGALCSIDSPQCWAEAALKLEKITPEQRSKIAKKIHNSAGQKPIYTHYEHLITELITNSKKNVT